MWPGPGLGVGQGWSSEEEGRSRKRFGKKTCGFGNTSGFMWCAWRGMERRVLVGMSREKGGDDSVFLRRKSLATR